MKQLSVAVIKELRVEPIWGFNNYQIMQNNAMNFKSLLDQVFMGTVILVIMRYSTLRRTEIHRANVEKRYVGTWQLYVQIIKVIGYKATFTFLSFADFNVCPAFWLQIVVSKKEKKVQRQTTLTKFLEKQTCNL
ncbi:MAG: hypothetical protein EZS28_040000 [Streblomastix strix]|uniref:Uncharacterized protein n=1 Tax=Streblomastix strix TaxID=222440 RepID=A0A5J4U2I8_9EUKA|nr:MAG: hypothetical protein EZS28_040000 [Streblomastix strix]